MALSVVDFPKGNVSDIPEGFRTIAKEIEEGLFGKCHNAVWVIDRGDGLIDVGLLGQAGESAPVAYFLLGLAKRKLESILSE